MRPRNSFIIATVLTIALLPAGAFAAVRSVNETESNVALAEGPTWYRYGTGTDLDIDPVATDDYDNTVRTGAGQVVLANTGSLAIPGATDPDTVAWWDDAWQARQCSIVGGTGVRYVDIPFDSSSPADWSTSGWMQSDYGDLVPVAHHGGTATTPDFWLATPFDGPDGHVFVEVDFDVASPQTVCLYFGHDAGGQISASDPQLSQNWAGLQPIYELINPNYSSPNVVVSNPTLAPVTIATSAAGAGSTVVAPGAVVSYPLGSSTTLFADGAVITRGPDPGRSDESLTPLFHQGTLFVSATNRGRQRWCFAGAAGTSITVDPSNRGPVTFAHDPASPCREVDTNAHTVITTSAPMSAFHVNNSRQDPHALYPATDDALYGTPSRWLKLGVSGPGDVEFASSSTATTVVSVGANGYQSPSLLGRLGSARTHRLTPLDGQLLGAIQQRDDNGTDSTSFLPVEAMGSRYVLPLAATYVAIACPNVGDVILVNGSPRSCGASGGGEVGKLLLGSTAAGSLIESQSGSAFHLYYHPPNDETSVFIPRLAWAQVEGVPGTIQELPADGTWTATRSASTDVWGLFSTTATVPADTSVEWEVACAPTTAGPFAYAGIAAGEPLPHACDQFDVVSVRATLTTTTAGSTPVVSSADVERDLATDTAITVARDLTQLGRTWLWRIHDGTSEYAAETTDVQPGAASTGGYVVSLVDNAMVASAQVTASGGGSTDTGGADVQLHISSLVADVTMLPTGSDEIVWRMTSGPNIARTIVLD